MTFANALEMGGHGQLIPFTFIIFSFSKWDEKFSIDNIVNKKNKKKYFNVLPLFYLIISFSFFTSGFSKLINGWLNVNYQATWYYAQTNFILTGRKGILYDFLMNSIQSKYFWELADYFTIVLEIAPLLLWFYVPSYKITFILISFFHVVVDLTMGIPFVLFPLLYIPFILQNEETRVLYFMRSFDFKYNKLLLIVIILLFILYYYIVFFFFQNTHDGVKRFLLSISLYSSFVLIIVFFVMSLRNNFMAK